MSVPTRQRRLEGRHAQVDGVPFVLPVNSQDSPALMTGFTVDAEAAQALLPGNELHVVRLPRGKALLVVTVIDYRTTDIGSYVEFSIALACTHGPHPVSLPRVALGALRGRTGQYVWDLPVSTLVSVKGGKGIWGMPKHQANLDFRVGEREMSSQYDLDGQLCLRVTVKRPRFPKVPLREVRAVNFCQFRGMLVKSSIYFSDTAEVGFGPTAHAELLLGDHPRMAPLHGLGIAPKPLFTATLPHTHGVLDDHFESWFLSAADPVVAALEGLESVYGLPNDESRLDPPKAEGRDR